MHITLDTKVKRQQKLRASQKYIGEATLLVNFYELLSMHHKFIISKKKLCT